MKKFNRKSLADRSKFVSVNQVRTMLKSHDVATRELKVTEALDSGNTATSGGTSQITRGIVEGDESYQRSGRVISLKRLELWWQATMNASATTERVRVIVYSDKNSNGATPPLTDILLSVSVLSSYHRHVYQAKRFKILYDVTMPMCINGSNRAVNGKFVHNFKNHKVVYDGATDVDASLYSGHLFFAIISDTVTNVSTFAFRASVQYNDS